MLFSEGQLEKAESSNTQSLPQVGLAQSPEACPSHDETIKMPITTVITNRQPICTYTYAPRIDFKRSNLNNCVVIVPEGNVKTWRAQHRKTTPTRTIAGQYANHIIKSNEAIPVRITERSQTSNRQKNSHDNHANLYIFQL